MDLQVKSFHGPPHDVERQVNDWLALFDLKIKHTQITSSGLVNWSVGDKMPIVTVFIWYSEK